MARLVPPLLQVNGRGCQANCTIVDSARSSRQSRARTSPTRPRSTAAARNRPTDSPVETCRKSRSGDWCRNSVLPSVKMAAVTASPRWMAAITACSATGVQAGVIAIQRARSQAIGRAEIRGRHVAAVEPLADGGRKGACSEWHCRHCNLFQVQYLRNSCRRTFLGCCMSG